MLTANKFVKGARALRAWSTLVRDPSQLGRVFELRDSVADRAVMEKMAAHLERDPRGAAALTGRPRLGVLSLGELSRLPDGSVGRAFADHMRRAGLDPAALPSLPSPDRLSYLSAHLYETHDLWHVVTGFDVDVAGELGLQAFYLAQFPGLLSAAILSAGLLNTAIYAPEERVRRMDEITLGWQLGKGAQPLFGVDWAPLLQAPLVDVRRGLKLPEAGVAALRPAS